MLYCTWNILGKEKQQQRQRKRMPNNHCHIIIKWKEMELESFVNFFILIKWENEIQLQENGQPFSLENCAVYVRHLKWIRCIRVIIKFSSWNYDHEMNAIKRIQTESQTTKYTRQSLKNFVDFICIDFYLFTFVKIPKMGRLVSFAFGCPSVLDTEFATQWCRRLSDR